MPTSASFSTSCRDSAGRTHPSQRAAGLESEAGNPRSFSLDNWPPMFSSRTADPTDPCFVGKLADKARTPLPHQRLTGIGAKHAPPGVPVRRDSHAWLIWRLLTRQGPMQTRDIARHLDLLVPAVHLALNRRLLPGQAVVFTTLLGRGAGRVFSIGPAPVVEV